MSNDNKIYVLQESTTFAGLYRDDIKLVDAVDLFYTKEELNETYGGEQSGSKLVYGSGTKYTFYPIWINYEVLIRHIDAELIANKGKPVHITDELVLECWGAAEHLMELGYNATYRYQEVPHSSNEGQTSRERVKLIVSKKMPKGTKAVRRPAPNYIRPIDYFQHRIVKRLVNNWITDGMPAGYTMDIKCPGREMNKDRWIALAIWPKTLGLTLEQLGFDLNKPVFLEMMVEANTNRDECMANPRHKDRLIKWETQMMLDIKAWWDSIPVKK